MNNNSGQRLTMHLLPDLMPERLADIPTPAGPTPKELGAESAFIPLTQLTDTISRERDC
ncbi:hypothetical protein AB0O64_29255 [Streptomyces sp. NPDC088341]|uniref:hypothetical protein n=1 Tax=Streptomyces sp. NPDC088341 TaxID=3154870 RepID=UPI0034226D4D